MADDLRPVIWRPQAGPQVALLCCPFFEVFFGGARGGGKTDGMLGEWVAHQGRHAAAASGLMVRRSRTELYDTIERSRELYPKIGAAFNETEKLWRFPSGARLRFAYLENDADAEAYQGHAYTRVYVEEIGNFPNPAPIMKLMATLRSSSGVPVGMRATGNPGGPGHQWVRARYIDPAPMGYEIITDPETSLERVYIPAKVSDNQLLLANDPGYVSRLKASGSPELVRAWLEGDWSVVTGAYFSEFNLAQHVIAPLELPKHWVRFRAMDWGSAKPFSVGWYAVSDGEMDAFPRGCILKYREWYGMKPNTPNVGLKMTAEQVADGILEREAEGEKIDMSVLDPAAFSQDGGPSIAERMAGRKVFFQRADNSRVGARGAMGGWDLVRQRLIGEDDRPMIQFFSTCTHTIRTLPALQHDEKRPEDVDTDGEDHCFTGDTLVQTERGPAPIRDLVGTVGWVQSVDGLREYRNCRMTRRDAEVLRVHFSDGTSVACTPDHQFLTSEKHWKKACDLLDETCYAAPIWSQSLATQSKSSTVFVTTAAVDTSSGRAFDFIALSGSPYTGLCLTDSTSTMLTTTPATTERITLRWLNQPPTSHTIRHNRITWRGLSRSSEKPAQPLPSGMEARPGGAGTGSTTNQSCGQSWPVRLRSIASNAARHIRSWLQRLASPSSATRTAKPVRCVRVERLQERADVYCLEVPSTRAFALANGVIVHNCGDETRYACSARPWVRAAEKPKPVKYAKSTQLSVSEIIELKRRQRLGED